MTAFARQEEQTEQGELTCEVRSVNHRYLELSLRLDECFRSLEMPIRKLFTEKLSRGKVDAVLRYKIPAAGLSKVNIDRNLAKSVVDNCEVIAELSTLAAPIDPVKVLQWPGVLKTESLDQVALHSSIMTLVRAAIDELIVTRETEGAALKTMIAQRCLQIDGIARDVRRRMPEILTQHQQRLQGRVTELKVSLDPERLEQEMVLLAQKSDVAEELDRLESHVVEVQNVLQRDEPTGRRLDFLMQELNREANTLGSKSINTETTNHTVQLKVLIEQMREQIQNIE
jgi:uncharacterized protein (TIGR00255 family)